MHALDSLNKHFEELNSSSLRQNANCVVGDGNPDADILFIGEAPGKQEDLEGKPFVGASGKLLNQLLESIKLDRSAVYITNIVKFRPPNNRDPKPEEVNQLRLWLHEQINQINPLIIVPLGRHAMEYFLPSEKISEIHGQPHKSRVISKKELTIFPLYHPAAALYNPRLRETLFEDMIKLSSLLEKIDAR